MARYALNAHTGKVTLCRAEKRACPHIGQDHFDSADEAQLAFERQNEYLDQPISKNMVMDKEPPAWMIENKFFAEDMGGDYVVVNRFSHQGRSIVAAYADAPLNYNTASHQQTNGSKIVTLNYHDEQTGEVIGSIAASYKTEESMSKAYGDPDDLLTFVKYADQGSFDSALSTTMRTREEIQSDVYSLKEMWYILRVNSRHVNEEEFPLPHWADGELDRVYSDEVTKEMVMDDFKSISKTVAPEYHDDLERNRTPYVFHSNVADDVKGMGLGEKMYVDMAKQLGREGQVLAASFERSDDAQRLWDSMIKNENINTGDHMDVYDYDGKGYSLPYLDYR